MREVVATTSPSMDIQISSNFERYLFEASGRDAALIRAKMGALRQEGRFDLGPLKSKMQQEFAAEAASEKDVAEAIGRLRDECGYLMDPHTACGVVAAERALGAAGATPQVVLSTAHPAKFPDAIAAITGKRPALPERLLGPAHRTRALRRDRQRPERGGAPRRERHTRDQRGHGMTPTISTLPNGLRVVTQAMPNLETVSLGLWVGAGARHESDREHGISHFLEHMAFKGTKQRSAQEIAEEIEQVGGELNAATSLETTAYYARVLKGDEGVALGLIADILQKAAFGRPELEGERQVILQEIAATRDSPDDIAYDLLHDAAFPSQPVGRAIWVRPRA